MIACVDSGSIVPYRDALLICQSATPAVIASRLSSALRVRSLHATTLRRADMARADQTPIPDAPKTDPLEDATVIVAGRGRAYPVLSTAVAERAGLIGALTIETAARYLKAREIDGLVLGDGFGARNIDALLTVIAEDDRFRDLPVGVLTPSGGYSDAALPHLIFESDPAILIARILPMVRLHAFEARLRRLLGAFDHEGVVDAETGLNCFDGFIRNLDRAMQDAAERGSGLSLARFAFDASMDDRATRDAARLVSQIVRGADFACRDADGSILISFTETDLRHAHVVARRIASVLKQTMLTPDRNRLPAAPAVTLASRKSTDSAASLIARVTIQAVAAE